MSTPRRPGTPVECDPAELIVIDLNDLDACPVESFLDDGPAGLHLAELQNKLAAAQRNVRAAGTERKRRAGQVALESREMEINLTERFGLKIMDVLDRAHGVTAGEVVELVHMALAQEIVTALGTDARKQAALTYLGTLEDVFVDHLEARDDA